MYNLNEDLGEINDISKQNKSQLDSMFLSYHIWQQEMKTPLWVEGKDWMNVTYHIHQKLMQNKIPEYKDIWSPAFKEKKYK